MLTTQREFHTMRGHVADGVQVIMDIGHVLTMRTRRVFTLRASMKGWQIVDESKQVLAVFESAAEVMDFIVNY